MKKKSVKKKEESHVHQHAEHEHHPGSEHHVHHTPSEHHHLQHQAEHHVHHHPQEHRQHHAHHVEHNVGENAKSHLPTFKTEREIALDFATLVHRKFDNIIKASILFGSQAKDTASAGSDIDIVLIIDDAALNWDMEMIAWYREELGKIIASTKYGRELHINSIKLTTWWQDLMYGDPVVINIIRYGEPLLDIGGFFNPLKVLLEQGRIKSTHEAVYHALQRSPSHLLRSKAAVLNAIEGVYWSMIDAAQAALMVIGKLPPSPEHVPAMLAESFAGKGLLKSSYVKALKDIYYIHKGITHGRIKEVKGDQIDEWQKTAENFLDEMASIVNKVVDSQKKD
ncbi:MAG: nucleotidyltransferase domain-containing protein [Nanoarchaeota archaeon]